MDTHFITYTENGCVCIHNLEITKLTETKTSGKTRNLHSPTHDHFKKKNRESIFKRNKNVDFTRILGNFLSHLFGKNFVKATFLLLHSAL